MFVIAEEDNAKNLEAPTLNASWIYVKCHLKLEDKEKRKMLKPLFCFCFYELYKQ